MPVYSRAMTLYRFAGAGMLAAASVLVLAGCNGGVTDADIKRISLGEVRDLVDKSEGRGDLLLLVDPRPASAFAAGHLPGARNLPLPPAEADRGRDPTIARYQNIVVYGDDPGSPIAKAMTKRLMHLGYQGVRFFAGGLAEWSERGHPVTRPAGAGAN